jgi:hypothetical protein
MGQEAGKMKKTHTYLFCAIVMLMTGQVWAGSVATLNTFSSGTPAKASEVNQNFAAVKSAVDDNNGRVMANASAISGNTSNITSNANAISALQATLVTLQASITSLQADLAAAQNTISSQQTTITALQGQVAGINNSNVMTLEPYLTVDTISDPRGPLVRLTGVNLQVVNGMGSTAIPNGLGNVIIGYDTARNDSVYHCSIGWYANQTDCEANGGAWALSLKGGSHYLVIGDQNNYAQFGGIVAGYRNTGNGQYASVNGGDYNTASGNYASVSGGVNNIASGGWASVSGGDYNYASGQFANVSGGYGNTAGGYASVSGGGYSNSAGASYASVHGGYGNTASGTYSSVLGGNYLTATATYQTIPALP